MTRDTLTKLLEILEDIETQREEVRGRLLEQILLKTPCRYWLKTTEDPAS